MVTRSGLKAWVVIAIVVGAALLAAVIAPSGTPAEGKSDGHSVRGAGTTMLESGTGAPSFTPVITTGLGAGSDRPFTATVTRGGPGATLVLEVSGLTFREILLEGQFRF